MLNQKTTDEICYNNSHQLGAETRWETNDLERLVGANVHFGGEK
jgi:hypothetical protein